MVLKAVCTHFMSICKTVCLHLQGEERAWKNQQNIAILFSVTQLDTHFLN